jgi:protein dithiol:quinone oxidoreductase
MTQSRILFGLIFLICGALLSYGYYLQYYQGLDPCPLCIFQRVCYVLLGGASLIAAVHNPAMTGRRVYGGLCALFSLGGIVFAGRQVWLQHLPKDQVPECGPGLEYWIKTLPLGETIRKVFHGTGDCAEIDWTFLHLSIAEWSLIIFTLILLALLVNSWRRTA